MDHSLLPSIRAATLPEKYQAAKLALSECSRIDECKDWSDKAAAMASYAKQSQDKTLEHTAMRIRARAIQRCGELLREIEKGTGKNQGKSEAAHTLAPTRKAAAEQAGLSEWKANEAKRVANVPKDSFEEQVESDSPPSIKALADQGKRHLTPREVFERRGMTEKAFKAGMHLQGAIRSFAAHIQELDFQAGVEGLAPKERAELRSNIATIIKVLTQLNARL